MGLVDVQRVLAQLYTDRDIRERFLADPEHVGVQMGLSEEDVQVVAKVSAQQMQRFARSLQSKRFGEVCKLLPFTQKLLGKQFHQYFFQYADTYVPTGVKKHVDDALQFAAFLLYIHSEKGIEPPWVEDVVRYEQAHLLMAYNRRHVVVCWFRYDLRSILTPLERGDQTISPSKKRDVVVWYRLRTNGHAKRFMFSFPAG